MPRRASTRTTLIVLVLAAGSHDLLSKLMYAHLLPHGGGTAEQIRAGSQIMFYGGDAIDVALTLAVMLAWYARSGRQLAHDRRRAAALADPGLNAVGTTSPKSEVPAAARPAAMIGAGDTGNR